MQYTIQYNMIQYSVCIYLSMRWRWWCTRWMWLYVCIIWINTLRHEKHKRFTDWYFCREKKERKKHCEKNARKLLCYKCNSIWKRKIKLNRNETEKRARETRKITWFKEKYYFEYKIKSYINCFLWFHWKRLTKFGWWQSCRVHRPFDRCDCTILIAVKRFDFDLYCLHRMHLTEAHLRKKRRTK